MLLKAVVQAFPSYVLSCFKVPDHQLHSIEALTTNYWWNDKDKARSIHWDRWDNLCIAKPKEGLGFRDLCAFNLALLGKQAWRILMYPESMLAKVIKSKYFPKGDLFNARLGYRPSLTWTGIHEAIEVLRLGCRLRVGSGKNISIWHSPWLPRFHKFKILSPPQILDPEAKVVELISPSLSSWNSSLVYLIF